MKKFILICLIAIGLIGCAAVFNRLDPFVEKTKTEYINYSAKAEEIIAILPIIDTTVLTVKDIYWDRDNDTFTSAFNQLSDTKQLVLKIADERYNKFKKQTKKVIEDYKIYTQKVKKGYTDYLKIRDKSIQVEAFLKKIPSIISGYIKLKK